MVKQLSNFIKIIKSYIIISYMSHLEKLKQKMMIKPILKDQEKVEVIIKGKNIGEEGEITAPIKATLIIDETKKGFDRDAVLNKLKKQNVLKVNIKDISFGKQDLRQPDVTLSELPKKD